MGWHPDTVRTTHLSDFTAAFEGWRMVNVPAPTGPDYSQESIEQLDEIVGEEEVKAWHRRMGG